MYLDIVKVKHLDTPFDVVFTNGADLNFVLFSGDEQECRKLIERILHEFNYVIREEKIKLLEEIKYEKKDDLTTGRRPIGDLRKIISMKINQLKKS